MTFPAEPDIKVQAEVISYPAIARLTSLGRTVVDTLIRLDNPPEKILPGYSFNGTIVTGADSEALIVEQDAIRYVETGEYPEDYNEDTNVPQAFDADSTGFSASNDGEDSAIDKWFDELEKN